MSRFIHTPVTFTRDEVHRIRELMGTRDAEIDCPRCGEMLEVVGPIAGEEIRGHIYQVSCPPCHRSAIITDAPGTGQPAE